jgi:hypothetical protein
VTLTVEGPVRTSVSKRIVTTWPEGVPVLGIPFMDGRLATVAEVTWAHADGAWHPGAIRLTSSFPRRDGTPSNLSKTHVLTAGERRTFIQERPDVVAPTEHVTITITEKAEQ